ncbi:MAG: ThuA domain-containing protein [Reichenbachiella sp.]
MKRTIEKMPLLARMCTYMLGSLLILHCSEGIQIENMSSSSEDDSSSTEIVVGISSSSESMSSEVLDAMVSSSEIDEDVSSESSSEIAVSSGDVDEYSSQSVAAESSSSVISSEVLSSAVYSSAALSSSSSVDILSSSETIESSSSTPRPPLNVLLFTKTVGYHHESIQHGVEIMKELATTYNYTITHTNEASIFEDSQLDTFDVIHFLNTTKDILNGDQQDAFKRFIEKDRGFVGNHAATDTEYDWDYYQSIIGAPFASHPYGMQRPTVLVTGNPHPATDHITQSFEVEEECYNFRSVPSNSFTILLEYDESTYDAGNDAMGYHPMTWYRDLNPGRIFYTAFGHESEMYDNEFFKRMILNALFWASDRDTPEWQ